MRDAVVALESDRHLLQAQARIGLAFAEEDLRKVHHRRRARRFLRRTGHGAFPERREILLVVRHAQDLAHAGDEARIGLQ